MPQFAVYENNNEATRELMPYLLDVQSGILEHLSTRVVVPMSPVSTLGGKTIGNLCPVFDILGIPHTLLTPQLAGIDVSDLGNAILDLSCHRTKIINTLDFLFTGF